VIGERAVEWNDVQTGAKQRGWLVFAMDQGQTAWSQDSKYGVGEGYCIGLACQWLSDMYWSRSFDVGPDQVVELPPWKAVLVQKAATAGKDWTMWDTALLEYSMYRDAGLGMEDATMLTPDTARMAEKFRAVLEKSFGGYAWGCSGDAGAHAMAMFRTPGRLDLFDPNYGQFRFAENQVADGLKWFFDETTYKESFKLDTRIGFVNEPYNYDTSPPENYTRPKPFELRELPAEKTTLRLYDVADPEYHPIRRPMRAGRTSVVEQSVAASSPLQSSAAKAHAAQSSAARKPSKHRKKHHLAKDLKNWWMMRVRNLRAHNSRR
jgi:hypothetical protein